jgi:hypothetical protein
MIEIQEILEKIVTDRRRIAVEQHVNGVIGQVVKEPVDQFWVFMEHVIFRL